MGKQFEKGAGDDSWFNMFFGSPSPIVEEAEIAAVA